MGITHFPFSYTLKSYHFIGNFRKERKLFDQYQKAARAIPDKKEREEIDNLKKQVDKWLPFGNFFMVNTKFVGICSTGSVLFVTGHRFTR